MISELAYIDSKAALGANVEVKPFAYIEGDVVIGAGTIVDSGAKILAGARIGENCHIHGGAVISGTPQDLKYDGEYSTCVIGNNTTIRECATINKGTKAKGKTVVGDDCLIMAYAHIAHDCIVGNRAIIVNNVSLAGEVEVGDWAILGGHAAVHQFVKIGKHVIVSGGTLLTKDVPPYVKVGKNPNSYLGLNSVGLRRRGFDMNQISSIQEIYRILFQSGLNTKNAYDKIVETHSDSDFKSEILSFVDGASRGMIKSFSSISKED